MTENLDREQTITLLHTRARMAESGLVRVLSRDEIEWLVEPVLPKSLKVAKAG